MSRYYWRTVGEKSKAREAIKIWDEKSVSSISEEDYENAFWWIRQWPLQRWTISKSWYFLRYLSLEKKKHKNKKEKVMKSHFGMIIVYFLKKAYACYHGPTIL